LDLGQKNSSLEIMIYSFFKQEFFTSFNFISSIFYGKKYFLIVEKKNFCVKKFFFNIIERNKKNNFTTFLATMKIGIKVENRSCKKRTWMDFSLIHIFSQITYSLEILNHSIKAVLFFFLASLILLTTHSICNSL